MMCRDFIKKKALTARQLLLLEARGNRVGCIRGEAPTRRARARAGGDGESRSTGAPPHGAAGIKERVAR